MILLAFTIVNERMVQMEIVLDPRKTNNQYIRKGRSSSCSASRAAAP